MGKNNYGLKFEQMKWAAEIIHINACDKSKIQQTLIGRLINLLV